MTTPIRGRACWATLALALALLLPAAANAQNAYITNSGDNTVSVIDTATNKVVGTTIPVGFGPFGVAVTPDGAKVYVANDNDVTVSVIDTATDIVITTIPVGKNPAGVAVTPDGAKVYVGNFFSSTVSVIDTATNTVIATIPVGVYPFGVAVTPDGAKVYVANFDDSTVSVIDTATDTVGATIPVPGPVGIAITPDGAKAYVTNSSTVSVIATASNTVVATIPVGGPYGVAVTPDGAKVYVSNYDYSTVSVIDTATDTVGATIPVGPLPSGVAVTPDGAKVYVANQGDDTVSVIATATNTVTATIPAVGNSPIAFGKFIGVPLSSGSPPVAVNETAATTANTPVTIDLTAGASGNPSSAALAGTPAGGTVTGFPATTVTFTPTTGFTGAASFQFTLANASGTSNTATATITVTGPPTAVNESAMMVANVPAPIDLSKGASGSPTSAALVGTPVGGTVTGFPATTVTFTPTKDLTGAASFQFTLANASGTSNTATATITVKGPDPNFNLSASAYCNTSPPVAPAIKLSWTAQGGTQFYDLYRNGELYSQNIAQISFDNNANVMAGSAYAYFVVAHASAGDVESNQASVAVPGGTCSPAALPDLVIQNLLLSGSSVAAGSGTVLKFIVHNKTPLNKGGLAAAPSVTHIRLSKSGDKVTVNDPLLLSLSTPAIAPEGDKTKADSVDVIEQVTIPNNQAAGSYYLWVILDSTSSAGHGPVNEQNDKMALPIVVTNPVAGPDLVVRNLNLTPTKIAPGASTTVSFSIANQGSMTASLSTTKVILSASNSDIRPTDLLLGSFQHA